MTATAGGALPLGLSNFRDLGGLPTIDGRRTRHGLLFRSESLHELCQTDVLVLRDALGIRTVIDLRASLEMSTRPHWVDDVGIEYANLPFSDEFDEIDPALDAQAMHKLVGRKYESYLVRARDNIVAALGMIADAVGEAKPTVFNCTFGKDRTGVLAALVLELVQVKRSAIIDDYVTSQAAMGGLLVRMASDPVHGPRINSTPAAVYRADRHSMEAFLERLDSLGTAAGWAIANGFDRDQIDRLRAGFVS